MRAGRPRTQGRHACPSERRAGSEAHERRPADRAVAAGRGVRRPMPWERRVPPAPVIPAQAGIRVSRERRSWERGRLARIDRLRTRYGPHAGGTPAHPGARAFPGAPCVCFRAPGGRAKRMNDVRRIGRWRPVAETGDRCSGNGASCPLRSFPRKRESRCPGNGAPGSVRERRAWLKTPPRTCLATASRWTTIPADRQTRPDAARRVGAGHVCDPGPAPARLDLPRFGGRMNGRRLSPPLVRRARAGKGGFLPGSGSGGGGGVGPQGWFGASSCAAARAASTRRTRRRGRRQNGGRGAARREGQDDFAAHRGRASPEALVTGAPHAPPARRAP